MRNIFKTLLTLLAVSLTSVGSQADYASESDDNSTRGRYCLKIIGEYQSGTLVKSSLSQVANFIFNEPVNYICKSSITRSSVRDIKFSLQAYENATSTRSSGTQLSLSMLRADECVGCLTEYRSFIGQLKSQYFVDRYGNNLVTFSREAAAKFLLSVDAEANRVTISYDDFDGESYSKTLLVELL